MNLVPEWLTSGSQNTWGSCEELGPLLHRQYSPEPRPIFGNRARWAWGLGLVSPENLVIVDVGIYRRESTVAYARQRESSPPFAWKNGDGYEMTSHAGGHP